MKLYQISLKYLLRQVLALILILSAVVPVVLAQPATTVYADKAGVCGVAGRDGPATTLKGVVNAYYPGTADVAAGATSLPVGAVRPGSVGPAITAGDLLLVVQMQGADLDGNNDERYGDGVGTAGTAGNTVVYSAAGAYAGSNLAANFSSGNYEYVVATGPIAAGSVPISSGLVNSYFSAAFAIQGQRTFQVIRVPQYSSVILGGTVTALRWDGSTGGIVAFEDAGALDWNGNTVDVNALGFRGGGGRQLRGGGGINTDYRTMSTINTNGSKGEGYAGTPRFLNNNGALLDNGIANEGFLNGSYGRGASGNGGGGSTDGNPAVNDQNSGGGGGGNGGFGGKGGDSWNSGVVSGGFGGAPFPGTAPRLIMGGGGGAGTTNDGTGAPAAGFASSGAAGGGVVMIRANTITGTGTVTANGATANQTVLNDGGGGGGAGGSVIVIARSGGSVGTLTVTAQGGNGGITWPARAAAADRHGPGGGGGGGFVFTSNVLAVSNVSGGLNGTTTTANDPFGATPGGAGSLVTNITRADLPNFIDPGPCIPPPPPPPPPPGPSVKSISDPASGILIPVTGFAPNTVTDLNSASRPAYNSTNLSIEIPVIKVNTSIVGIQLKNRTWNLSWLQGQAGWLNGTAYPTQIGNSVITGHVVNADGKPGVFFKLKYLNTGEYVFVYASGYRYTYQVVSNKFVQPDDVTALKHEDKAYLTLITCDTYDEKTDTYLRRVVVHAVLVDMREVK